MENKEVRVRYAPSPTGLQHIGGVRFLIIFLQGLRAENSFFAWKILTAQDTMKNT